VRCGAINREKSNERREQSIPPDFASSKRQTLLVVLATSGTSKRTDNRSEAQE
jgi:hypothetical protein